MAAITLLPLPGLSHSARRRRRPCCYHAQMYPCRLSLVLLPYFQSLQAATLVDCARRFAAIYGAPWHIRFKLQLGLLGAYGIKAVGSVGLAVYTYFWIRDNK